MVLSAFRASLPVAFGYIPLGMAFGVLLVGLSYSWWWAPLMGLFIFAGSAQFLAVSLLAAGAGVTEAFTATLVLNFRHVFYGMAVFDRFRAMGPERGYAIFGLTDETFSLIASSPPRVDERRWIVRLTAWNQAWWVLGCTFGALLGHSLPFSTEGLAFSLTALFVVLLVEQLLKDFQPLPVFIALTSATVCLAFLPGKFFLLASIGLSAFGLFVGPWINRRLKK